MSVITLGDYLLGKLEILKGLSRSGSTDINDSTVSTTFETADLTALAGTDVAALYGTVTITDATGTNDSLLLLLQEVGGDDSTGQLTRAMRISAELGANGIHLKVPFIIPARGTDPGKFEYAEFSTAHDIDSFQFVYWGRIRP